MKKRILALACALTLVFGMTLSVSAADGDSNTSPNAASDAQEAQEDDDDTVSIQNDATEVVTIPNSTGQSFDGATIAEFARTTTISSGVTGAAINPVSNETAKAIIATANSVIGANAFIASVVDLSVPEGTGTATFTLACPNVWKGQNVSILHLKSDGTYEVIKPSSVENQSVTFTMTSYSPIAIVIDTAAPKTADSGLASGMLIAALALIGAAGAYVYGRRARA